MISAPRSIVPTATSDEHAITVRLHHTNHAHAIAVAARNKNGSGRAKPVNT
jgi:hypothetical protein